MKINWSAETEEGQAGNKKVRYLLVVWNHKRREIALTFAMQISVFEQGSCLAYPELRESHRIAEPLPGRSLWGDPVNGEYSYMYRISGRDAYAPFLVAAGHDA